MKTSSAKQTNSSRFYSVGKSTRTLSSALLILLVTAFVTGCATYYTKTFTGTSRTYDAWKNVKPGTKVTFKGTIRYGGKDFPVEIQQKLTAAPFPKIAILNVSYFVAGRPAGIQKAYIPSNEYGPSTLQNELAMLKAGVPPSGSARKTIFSTEPVPGMRETFVFEPRQKTFQINGRSVTADRYTLTIKHTGSEEHIFAWFSSGVPGGWIAVEKPSSEDEDSSAQVSRQLFGSGKQTAASMFQLNEGISVRLVSVEEP